MKKFILLFICIILSLPVFAEAQNYVTSEIAKVIAVQYVDTGDVVVQTKQQVKVEIITGEFKGEELDIDNVITGNPYYDLKLKKGQKVILHGEDNGDGIEYSIEDIHRSGALVWLSLIFCALLIYVGRKKGLYSLVSIFLTVVLIVNCLSPLILMGLNPVFAALLVCVLSTVITMYLVGGVNAKSTSASLGAVLSLIFAAILSETTMSAAHLTGFNGENTSFLYAAHPELDFIALAVSMMVLATLGAVMDVAMSISSTINEIYSTDNSKTVKELFISGMNVGRDIIGTMANTLILVYLGGSLPLVLLAGNIDLQKFINLNQVVTEIASALIGSIAIVICVPFTALVASWLIHKYAKKAELSRLPWE